MVHKVAAYLTSYKDDMLSSIDKEREDSIMLDFDLKVKIRVPSRSCIPNVETNIKIPQNVCMYQFN